jgi:Alpha/beta hydrolase family
MSPQPSQHHLEVPGGTVYYEVRGSGPLLLVIGQPMTSGPFAPLADLLAEDHTVVTYDPHGLGESTVEDPALAITPEIEADDLAHIVDAVGGGPADVFGSSGGAVAGLALAAGHSKRSPRSSHTSRRSPSCFPMHHTCAPQSTTSRMPITRTGLAQRGASLCPSLCTADP